MCIYNDAGLITAIFKVTFLKLSAYGGFKTFSNIHDDIVKVHLSLLEMQF